LYRFFPIPRIFGAPEFLAISNSLYNYPVWQNGPYLQSQPPYQPLLSGSIFSPTEPVSGSTVSGVTAGRRYTGKLTTDSDEQGVDSVSPVFPPGAGAGDGDETARHLYNEFAILLVDFCG